MTADPDPLTAAARAEVARVYGDTVPEWSTEKAAQKQLDQASRREASREFQQFDTGGWRRRRRRRERDHQKQDEGDTA